eukprot:11195660-Prorocentrum_lima.AAC.1
MEKDKDVSVSNQEREAVERGAKKLPAEVVRAIEKFWDSIPAMVVMKKDDVQAEVDEMPALISDDEGDGVNFIQPGNKRKLKRKK